MLNGQDLIDRLACACSRHRASSESAETGFEYIQYLIPVIRKLKLDTTVDVVNAYLNNIGGNGAYYLSEAPQITALEPVERPPYFCWGRENEYAYRHGIKRDVAAHGATIPDELVYMARRYSIQYLLKLISAVMRVHLQLLDEVDGGVREGLRVPIKFNHGLKQLRDDLTLLATSCREYEWHKLFLKLKDARINIFPDVYERERINSAFARWMPDGSDAVTAYSDYMGKTGGARERRSYTTSMHQNNINTVRVDPCATNTVREMIYRVYPGNTECLKKCNFDALADAMEIAQYVISVLNRSGYGADRLVEPECTAIYDKYAGSAKNLDESFYMLTPLAAILTAKCLSSSLYVDCAEGNGCLSDIRLWSYFTVPGTMLHAPDNDIAVYIDTEIKRQKDLVRDYIRRETSKRSSEMKGEKQ